MNRRTFLVCSAGAVASLGHSAGTPSSLQGEVGITTGSFTRHLAAEAAPGKLRLLDLPRLMRDELDLKVIDLMTATLVSLQPAYLERLRGAAADAGCVLSNLKINFNQANLGHPDPVQRRAALDEFKGAFDAAVRLGVRWVRPLPGVRRADLPHIAESYRELCDHAAARGLTVLVENIGWMKDDPAGIPDLIREVGPRLRAQPDTGNWSDAVRYEGLARAFPHAVSCDFKAMTLAPDGTHPAYDLARCFDLGWKAGFRGPWLIEHFHADLKELVREMALLRDQLRTWTRERSRV